MLEAIFGDIVDSTYRWHNIKTEEFELESNGNLFTDGTKLSIDSRPLHQSDCVGGKPFASEYSSDLAEYGNKGIATFDMNSDGKALVSDETQMTLFHRLRYADGCNTWLRNLPEMAHQRTPGNTCLSTCESLYQVNGVQNIALKTIDPSKNINKGEYEGEYDSIETPEKRQWYDRYCEMKPIGFI